jgi:hypothetical protein
MQWLLIIAALVASYQPQPKPTEPPSRSEQALRGFELYSAIASTNAALADDQVEDGLELLYHRAAHFVHGHGKADPAEAIKAAAIVVQIPEVKALGARLNVGPLEIEKREGATASADEKWVTIRTATLLRRKDLGPVLPLVTDITVPLLGRARMDILSDKDREEQLNARWTVLVTALQLFRESSGSPAKLSDEDSKAASKLAQEQLDRDYMRINGYFVSVRGHAAACAHLDVEAVAKAIVEWVGPALIELENVRRITLAPDESGWVVVDADTGWSLRDPTIGKFSSRDVLMLQRGLHSRAVPSPPGK